MEEEERKHKPSEGTLKRFLVIEEGVASGLNRTEACRRAGYSQKNANQIIYEMVRKYPELGRRLELAEKEYAAKCAEQLSLREKELELTPDQRILLYRELGISKCFKDSEFEAFSTLRAIMTNPEEGGAVRRQCAIDILCQTGAIDKLTGKKRKKDDSKTSTEDLVAEANRLKMVG